MVISSVTTPSKPFPLPMKTVFSLLPRCGLMIPGLMAIAGMMASSVQASVLMYELNTVFSMNSVAPDNPAPWLTARFEDIGSNLVQLRLTASNFPLDGTGSDPSPTKVNSWWFNFNSTKNVNNLQFTLQPGSSSVSAPTILKEATDGAFEPGGGGNHGFKADGDGYFDILFDFTTGMDAFIANESLIYNISLTGGAVLASDFNFSSFGSPPSSSPYGNAAHLGHTQTNNKSAFIADTGGELVAIPESSASAILLGCAAVISVAVRLRRKVAV